MDVFDFGEKAVEKFRAKVQAHELYLLGCFGYFYSGEAVFTKHWNV